MPSQYQNSPYYQQPQSQNSQGYTLPPYLQNHPQQNPSQNNQPAPDSTSGALGQLLGNEAWTQGAEGLVEGGMDREDAFSAVRPTMGQQGAQAAVMDYQNEVGNIATQNERQDAQYGRLTEFTEGMGRMRQAGLEGILEDTENAATAIEGQGAENHADFLEYRDAQMDEVRSLTEEATQWAKKAYNDYDEQSMATVSAAVGGQQEALNANIQQLRDQAKAQGLDPEMVASQEFQMRSAAAKQVHGNVSQMQDQRSQLKAQLGNAVSAAFQQAGSTMAGVSGEFGRQTLMSQEQQAKSVEAAAMLRKNKHMEVAQNQAIYGQYEMMGMEATTNFLRALPPSSVAMFDMVLQSAFALESMGGRDFLDFDRLGQGQTPFTQTPNQNDPNPMVQNATDSRWRT